MERERFSSTIMVKCVQIRLSQKNLHPADNLAAVRCVPIGNLEQLFGLLDPVLWDLMDIGMIVIDKNGL